jgi:hypothetical protein
MHSYSCGLNSRVSIGLRKKPCMQRMAVAESKSWLSKTLALRQIILKTSSGVEFDKALPKRACEIRDTLRT